MVSQVRARAAVAASLNSRYEGNREEGESGEQVINYWQLCCIGCSVNTFTLCACSTAAGLITWARAFTTGWII